MKPHIWKELGYWVVECGGMTGLGDSPVVAWADYQDMVSYFGSRS